MIRAGQHVVVTGAAGFVGRRLVASLLADPAFASMRLTINDLVLADTPADPRVRAVAGDFGDPAVRAAMLGAGADTLFHIGGVLGGAAEADPVTARAVNIDATLSLLEAVYNPEAPPRFVFASSMAVFGVPFPEVIDDATPPNPTMVYGVQKAMIELAIGQASARGWIDGIALRLPGIVARPAADARLKSAFLGRLFEVFGEGADLTLPVSPDGTTWLLSIRACVAALVHAARISGDALGCRRAITLPAQTVRFDDLVAALGGCDPERRTRIAYRPDPTIEPQFGRQPPLLTPFAESIGFRHDGDVATLVASAL